jgi:hypothetical protein
MRAYESPNPWSFEDIWKHRVDDAIHYLYPTNLLPPPFNKGLRKDAFKDAMHFFGSVIDEARFEVHHVSVDTRNRTALLRVTGHFDLKAVSRTEDHDAVAAEKDWQAQYMLLFHMDDNGSKVVRIDEFMDAQRLMEHLKTRAEQMMASMSGANSANTERCRVVVLWGQDSAFRWIDRLSGMEDVG